MRQETHNTFDQGLNMDINPNVTPNNVLTDSLNGTFITFNGDELSLQNDSGNTKIAPYWNPMLYPEWKSSTEGYNEGEEVKYTDPDTEEATYYVSLEDNNTKALSDEKAWKVQDRTVRLSEGFYPLGVKEYGGVLYIVSGKKGTGEKGNEDLIEFGSYPSPKFGSYSTKGGDLLSFTGKDSLYKSRTLNELFFKSGGYINFSNQGDIDLSNVTVRNKQKIYNIMLLHQLDSGTFDLTENIWEKYTEYRKDNPSEPEHWIASKNFNYFCPSQYKGKLVLRIELDEPKFFEFAELPSIKTIDSKFEMSFRIDWEDSDSISILGYKMRITYDTGEQKSLDPVLLPEAKKEQTVILEKEKIVTFEVVPVFKDYSLIDFPDEVINKYTLEGSILLEEKFLSMYFGLSGGECDIKKGAKTYKELIFSNDNGPLGLDLEVLEDNENRVVFLAEYKSPTPDANQTIVGRFKVEGEKAKFSRWVATPDYEQLFLGLENGPEIVSSMINKIGETVVVKSDPSCYRFNIKIKFNLALPMENTMMVENDGLQFFLAGEDTPLDFVSYDGRTFEIEVQQFKDLYIRISSSFSNYESRSSGRTSNGESRDGVTVESRAGRTSTGNRYSSSEGRTGGSRTVRGTPTESAGSTSTSSRGSTLSHTEYVPDNTYNIALITQIDHSYGLADDIPKRTFYTDAIAIDHKDLMRDLFSKPGNITYTPYGTGTTAFDVDYQIRDNEIRWVLNFNEDTRSGVGSYGGTKALSVEDGEYINISDVRDVKYHKFGNEREGYIITQSSIKSGGSGRY